MNDYAIRIKVVIATAALIFLYALVIQHMIP